MSRTTALEDARNASRRPHFGVLGRRPRARRPRAGARGARSRWSRISRRGPRARALADHEPARLGPRPHRRLRGSVARASATAACSCCGRISPSCTTRSRRRARCAAKSRRSGRQAARDVPGGRPRAHRRGARARRARRRDDLRDGAPPRAPARRDDAPDARDRGAAPHRRVGQARSAASAPVDGERDGNGTGSGSTCPPARSRWEPTARASPTTTSARATPSSCPPSRSRACR